MHKTRTLKPGIRFALTILSWTAFAILIAIGAFLLYYFISTRIYASRGEEFAPKFQIFTIISPSMEPKIKVYDVIINTRVDSVNDIKTGDVITFVSQGGISNGMTVTHRIIETLIIDGKVMYRTQGDNNASPDSALVSIENIKGRTFMKIPQLGRLQFFLASRGGWFFAILIPALGIIVYDILKLFKLVGVKKKVEKVIADDAKIDEDKIQLEKQRKKDLKKKLKKEKIEPKPIPIPEEIPEEEEIEEVEEIEEIEEEISEVETHEIEETTVEEEPEVEKPKDKERKEKTSDEILDEILTKKAGKKKGSKAIPVKDETPEVERVNVTSETDKIDNHKAIDETIDEIKRLEERLQSIKSVIEEPSLSSKPKEITLPKEATEKKEIEKKQIQNTNKKSKNNKKRR